MDYTKQLHHKKKNTVIQDKSEMKDTGRTIMVRWFFSGFFVFVCLVFLTNIWCFWNKNGGKGLKTNRYLQRKDDYWDILFSRIFSWDPGENSWPSLLCSSKLLNLAGWRYNTVEYYSKCLWGFCNKKSMHLINSTNLSNGHLKFPKHGKKQNADSQP